MIESLRNELITLRTEGLVNAMQSMKDIEALFDKVTSNYRPLLNGERYLSDVEVSHRLKLSRRTLQEYRDSASWAARCSIVSATLRNCLRGAIILRTSYEKSHSSIVFV